MKQAVRAGEYLDKGAETDISLLQMPFSRRRKRTQMSESLPPYTVKNMRFMLAVLALAGVASGQTPTATTINVPATLIALGQRVSLSATVTPAATGTVEFLDGFEIIGSAVLNSSSVATLPYRFPIAKAYRLRAAYVGNSSFSGSTSNPQVADVRGLLTRSVGAPMIVYGKTFADANMDGFLDILGRSAAYLGNGNGGFGPPVPHSGEDVAMAADFNSDGKLDILTTARAIHFGNGDGSFGAGQTTTLPVLQRYSLDLNRDGRPDPVGSVIETRGNVFYATYSYGRGGSQFDAPRSLPETLIGFADFNLNSIADVISDSRPYNTGRGLLTLLDLSANYPALGIESVSRVLIGDLNNDSRDDVVTVRAAQQGFGYDTIIQLSNPAGGFLTAVVVSAAQAWRAQQIVDWNGDGKADLLLRKVLTSDRSQVAYMAGHGDGTFDSPVAISLAPGFSSLDERLTAMDITGDGYLDFVITRENEDAAQILAGTPVASPGSGFTAPVSVSPLSITGTGTAFTVRYQAGVANGAPSPAVSRAYLLFSGTADVINAANACFVEIDLAANAFRLANDAGTGFSASIPAGAAIFTSNSKCALSGTNSNAGPPSIGATAEYSASVNIAFFRTFNGTRTVYLLTQGTDGSTSGWLQQGVYTVQSNDSGPITKTGAPFIIPPAPFTSTGAGLSATGLFGHTAGAGGHYLGYILLLPTPSTVNYNAAGTCLIEYNRLSHGMRLINDAGTGWLGGESGMPVGQPGGALANAACTVSVAGSTISIANEQMAVTVPVAFAGGFGPQIGVFTQALDVNGRWTGMQQIGNVVSTVANTPRPGPNVTVTPPNAGNLFRVSASITALQGTVSLEQVHLRISRHIVGSPACHVVWLPGGSAVALIDDAGAALVPPGFLRIGTPGTLSNSQCAIDTGNATFSASGEEFILEIPITPSLAFQGYTYAFGNAFYYGGLQTQRVLTHWRVTPSFFFQ